jgi:hypothetical protein
MAMFAKHLDGEPDLDEAGIRHPTSGSKPLLVAAEK